MVIVTTIREAVLHHVRSGLTCKGAIMRFTGDKMCQAQGSTSAKYWTSPGDSIHCIPFSHMRFLLHSGSQERIQNAPARDINRTPRATSALRLLTSSTWPVGLKIKRITCKCSLPLCHLEAWAALACFLPPALHGLHPWWVLETLISEQTMIPRQWFSFMTERDLQISILFFVFKVTLVAAWKKHTGGSKLSIKKPARRMLQPSGRQWWRPIFR